MLKPLYRVSAPIRAVILWFGFLAALWVVFGIAYLTHPQAWTEVSIIPRQSGWEVFGYIIGRNALLLLFIAAGNLFIRFGSITPGLLILVVQAVIIGWTAGTNSFMEPFPSAAQANFAFLRIGLWEVTAYALICAVTLPKSLLITSTFPAKQWDQQRMLKDIRFTKSEWVITAASLLCLIGAAYVEAFNPI